VASVALIAASPAQPASAAPPPGSVTAVFEAINAERTARGLPRVAFDGGTGAQCAADAMAAQNRLFHSTTCGALESEVAASAWDTSEVVSLWMRSDLHRRILMNPGAVSIQVGITCGAGSVMFVAVRADLAFDRWTDAIPPASPVITPGSGGSLCPIPRYVDFVYVGLLHRHADPTGIRYWSGRLGAGVSRSDFANQIAHSLEWTRVVAQDLYRLALGRIPDPAGLDYWAALVSHGLPTAAVAASLFGSPEAWHLGGGTPEGAVDRTYRLLLGRPADAVGLAYWSGELRRGVPFTMVAFALYQAWENRMFRVAHLYRVLLERNPDGAGQAFWADQLLRQDDVALAALLVASDEYFNRAQTR